MKSLGWNISRRLSINLLYDNSFVFGAFFEKSANYGEYLQLDIMLGYMSILITYAT